MRDSIGGTRPDLPRTQQPEVRRSSLDDIDEDGPGFKPEDLAPEPPNARVTQVRDWPIGVGNIQTGHDAVGNIDILLKTLTKNVQSLQFGGGVDFHAAVTQLALVTDSIGVHPMETEAHVAVLEKEVRLLKLMGRFSGDKAGQYDSRINELQGRIDKLRLGGELAETLQSTIGDLHSFQGQLGPIIQAARDDRSFKMTWEEAEKISNSANSSEEEKAAAARQMLLIQTDATRNTVNEQLEELKKPGLSAEEVTKKIAAAKTAVAGQMSRLQALQAGLIPAFIPMVNNSVSKLSAMNLQDASIEQVISTLMNQLGVLEASLSAATPEQRKEIEKQMNEIKKQIDRLKQGAKKGERVSRQGSGDQADGKKKKR